MPPLATRRLQAALLLIMMENPTTDLNSRERVPTRQNFSSTSRSPEKRRRGRRNRTWANHPNGRRDPTPSSQYPSRVPVAAEVGQVTSLPGADGGKHTSIPSWMNAGERGAWLTHDLVRTKDVPTLSVVILRNMIIALLSLNVHL